MIALEAPGTNALIPATVLLAEEPRAVRSLGIRLSLSFFIYKDLPGLRWP